MSDEKNRKMEQGRKPKKAGIGNLPGKKKEDFFIVLDDTFMEDPDKIMKKIMITDPEKKAKGGRVGFKSGMSVCKLAKRGKGKAYGKNS